MWIGAWTGRPGYAAMQSTRGYFWVLLWFLIPALMGLKDNSGILCLGLFFVPLMALSGFANRDLLREKLVGELRAIASAPIPAKDDPKFKRWNPKLIYPGGLYGNLDWQKIEARQRLRKGLLD